MQTTIRMIITVLLSLIIGQTVLAKTVEINRLGTIEMDDVIQVKVEEINAKKVYEFLGEVDGVWRCMIVDIKPVEEDQRKDNALEITNQIREKVQSSLKAQDKAIDMREPKWFLKPSGNSAVLDIYDYKKDFVIHRQLIVVKGRNQLQEINVICADSDVEFWKPFCIRIVAASQVK